MTQADLGALSGNLVGLRLIMVACLMQGNLRLDQEGLFRNMWWAQVLHLVRCLLKVLMKPFPNNQPNKLSAAARTLT